MQGAMEGKGEEEDEGHRMLRKREQLLLCVHCVQGPPTCVPCGEVRTHPLRDQGRAQAARPYIRGTVQLISEQVSTTGAGEW